MLRWGLCMSTGLTSLAYTAAKILGPSHANCVLLMDFTAWCITAQQFGKHWWLYLNPNIVVLGEGARNKKVKKT